MNELTPEKRQQLKIIVTLLVIAFFIIYGLVMYFKYAANSSKAKSETKNGQVIFKQSNLQFFQFTQQVDMYPDRILIHSPYLLIVRPTAWQTEIYNMQTKRKEKVIHEVLLDYLNGNQVYNKDGIETYYNDTRLKIVCDQAFIKSSTEILCVTRPDLSQQKNKLISINPETLEQKDVYESQNVLTAIYFAKETLYIGEYDFVKNKAFITVGNKTVPIADLVNVIYPIGDKIYAASFKSLRNNKTESYYEVISGNNKLATKLIKKGSIIFD